MGGRSFRVPPGALFCSVKLLVSGVWREAPRESRSDVAGASILTSTPFGRSGERNVSQRTGIRLRTAQTDVSIVVGGALHPPSVLYVGGKVSADRGHRRSTRALLAAVSGLPCRLRLPV